MLANATSTQTPSSDSFLDDIPISVSSIPDRSAKQITGWIAKIIFFNKETDYAIIRLESGIVVKGEWDDSELINSGEQYRWFGEWKNDERRGDYFAFSHAEPVGLVKSPPTIRKFLLSNGVPQAAANALIKAFGPDTLDVCRENPIEIVNREILGSSAAKDLQQVLQKSLQFQELRIKLCELFAGRGFPRGVVKACINTWGRRAYQVITRDPFKLLIGRIPGCGFKRCDQLYLDMGRPPQSLRRQFFAAWNEIDALNGDTWVLQGVVSMALKRQFGKSAEVEKIIRLGIRAKWFAARPSNRPGVQLLAEARKAEAERRIVAQLLWLLDEKCTSPILWPGANTLVFTSLTDHQAAQIAPCLTSRIFLLAGTPGTGKTFVAASLIREVMARGIVSLEDIKVCAPTGKAAVRITEYLQKNGVPIAAMTIHRMLGWQGAQFTVNRKKPLWAKIVVVDETSMVDTNLMACLLDAIPQGCHVLFLGDPYQLPPVGHGSPLRDMLRSNDLPKAVLSEIKRNDGAIVRACAAIKDGKRFKTVEKLEPSTGENLGIYDTSSAAESLSRLQSVIESVGRNGKFDPVWETQVLCPLNDKSEVSCDPLNRLLQNILNPLLEGESEVHNGFRLRDKIICKKNGLHQEVVPGFGHEGTSPTNPDDYEDKTDIDGEKVKSFIANGDQGKVLAINTKFVIAKFLWPDRTIKIPIGKKPTPNEIEEAGDKQTEAETEEREKDIVRKDLPPSKENPGNTPGSIKDFLLAYAMTGHKSQGSSWPLVIIMADEGGGMVASREWWYTTIPRAEKACLIIGNREVVFRQCGRSALNPRRTFLKETIEWEFMCKRLPEGF